jgi:hypothetical protein
VTSVDISAISKTAFKQGYMDGMGQQMGDPIYKPNSPDGKYSKRKMIKEIHKYYTDLNCVLIVSAGGFVTFTAVNDYFTDDKTNKSFISLIGSQATTDDTDAQFLGGVSVKGYDLNPNRLLWLLGKGHGQMASDIALMVNLNSVQSSIERVNWTGGAVYPCGNSSTNGHNDDSTFASAFNKVREKVIIVSSDPFFQHSKDKFVKAANDWLLADMNRYICYPLWDYRDSNQPPKGGQSAVFGPYLAKDFVGENGSHKSAYYTLGKVAANALVNKNVMLVDADWDSMAL